jgi:hypothetical protein
VDVELGLLVVVEEVVEAAAITQGDANRASAMAIPAAAVSCAVLVFILSSLFRSEFDIYLISEMVP